MEFLMVRSKEELSERKLEAYLKYAEIIDWGRKNPVRFCERFYGIELLDHQRYVFMKSWITARNVWCQSRGSGKALALDTIIPTPNGFSTMGDLKVNDYILDEKGDPTRITFTSGIFLGNECYELEFEDGEKIVADADHLWSIKLSGEICYGRFITETSSIFNGFKEYDFYIPSINLSGHKKIRNIKKVKSVATKCIQVDNPNRLYLCGEKFTVTHNTTLLAPFIMAKSNLFPKHQTFIMAGVGSQSQECFLKIERIAKNEIASFLKLTDFFLGEVEANHGSSDGFVHNPASFNYKLFNDSRVNSLNGNYDNNRSKRSSLNVYDESGFAPEDLFVTSMPFITQDSNFGLGGDEDIQLRPKKVPNQAIFASSASDMSTYFYQNAYKEYAKKMFLGDTDYFVADVNANIVFNAKYNGKIYPVSLLSKKEVEDEMRKNKEKCLREYFNKFSIDGGDKMPFKRATIKQNSEVRVPETKGDGTKRYVLAYDPARQIDNAVCLIAEICNDKSVGYKMKICGAVSFLDIHKKTKTPLQYQKQIELLKQMIVDYNGIGKQDYENIEKLLIDSGSGGGGRFVADFLMEDWEDKTGRKHRGILDKVEHSEYLTGFPNALDKVELISPLKYKTEMFDSLIEMLNSGLISFTEEYDNKGFLMLYKDSEYEYADDEDGSIKTDINRDMYEYKLSFEEELALLNIDLAKEELANFYRYDRENNRYSYDLAPDQKNKMNDDRAYCLSMLGWYLQKLRRGQILEKPQKSDFSQAPNCVSTILF